MKLNTCIATSTLRSLRANDPILSVLKEVNLVLDSLLHSIVLLF